MTLWLEWFRCVQALRPACARSRTFLWMCLALFGLCTRKDLGGVTSFVRAGGLVAKAYNRLLQVFHTPALALDTLTELWVRLALKLFTPLRAGTRPIPQCRWAAKAVCRWAASGAGGRRGGVA